MIRLALALMTLLLAGCGAAPDKDYVDRKFQNWQAAKFQDVARQRTDFTCGAAALSIISEHYYGKPITEVEFTTAIRATYSKEEWKEKEKNGLSMLDMKKAAAHFGFSAEGLKMTLRQLAELKGPVVVLLDKGYVQHFSVFKGIEGDRAYLADPISGNSRVPLYRFLEEWKGYAMAIWIEGEELPQKNALAVKPESTANEVSAVGRDALYAAPTKDFSPLGF